MNYYEHHLGDYVRDAGHLSMLEDGAYRRLMDAYYIREAALPCDVAGLCRLIRAQGKAEREAVAHVLREFFHLREDGWHHSRCDREIARYVEKREKARASAQARWHPAMRPHCDAHAHQTPIPTHQSPDSLPEERERSLSHKIDKEATRLGPDWTPDEAALGFAQALGFTAAEAQFEAAKFRDYWLGRAGREGLKRDWASTWRNWVRNAIERGAFERRGAAGSGGKTAPQALDKAAPVFLVTRGEPEHAAWLAHYVRIGRHRDPRAAFLDRLSVPERWPPQDEAAFHGEQDVHSPHREGQGA